MTTLAPEAAALVERCTALVRGRDLVLVGGVLAGATARVAQLRAFGARRVLVVAMGVGTGDLPTPQDAESIVVPPARMPTRLREEITGWVAFAAEPPDRARAAVEAFDPEGGALCLLDPVATASSYLGRQVLGGRTPEAAVLEDKTLCDQIWESVGIPHAPYQVVATELGALREAAARLDAGYGTVWAGDAANGMNGGGDSVRWVRDAAEAAAAAEFLAATSPRTRVMPFLEGVPCSIHGFVLADGVAVFRPVELCVLRGVDASGRARFVSAGISSCWEPPAADREHLRQVARAVGAHLSRTMAYRGGFSVDGVLTRAGWLPNELNPRYSAGLNTLARGIPQLPMGLLQAAVVRGIDVGATARVVEDLLLPAADASPYGSAHCVVPGRRVDQRRLVEVTGGPDGLRVAGPGDPVVGTLELGPAQQGGLVRFLPARCEPGLRLAPLSAAAVACADRLWDTGIGTLTAAPDVRAG